MNGQKKVKLILEDGTEFHGYSFGYEEAVSGELVFNTAMTGYPESLTDPSYRGQIIVSTFPLTGNYGVPGTQSEQDILKNFESDKIHAKAIITSYYSETYSHWNARTSLADWLKQHKVPGIYGIDTRELTIKLREEGAQLARIEFSENDSKVFYNPDEDHLVKQVSVPEPVTYGNGKYKVLLVDCGVKNNIIRNLLERDVTVLRVPFNYSFNPVDFDGVFISNGPGDPAINTETIENIQKALKADTPVMGICLGCQLMALATGAKTYKLKYGHRGHNQPVLLKGTNKCYITSQNHGFAIDEKTLSEEWELMFTNANDGTCEGIRHKMKPFFAAQFHPEASGGPTDTEFLFDEFMNLISKAK